ncbi:MAG: RagB/SusD family nutrient uptake outer membrane protein [Bacteroidales bacterium]|nr:RagB/SusD family nutrient uptake outer membrane protein [Bacteroidales bacterium]
MAFTTGENAQAAVNGLYYSMHVLYLHNCYFNDICTDGGFKQGHIFEQLNQANIQAVDSNDYMWTLNYFTISRANIIIETVPKMDEELFKAVHTKEQMVAEARFMRAFSYMNLTDLYYQVPLTLSSDLDVRDIRNYDSIDIIEEAIENDLILCKNDLPYRYPRAEASRPTRGAACGLLCRLYMRQAGRARLQGKDDKELWNKALAEANAVLDLEGSEYQLLNNVKAPFDASSEDGLNNKELIFAVRSSDTIHNCSWYLGLEFTPWEYDYGWGEYWVPLEVAWAMDPADKRLTDLIVRDYTQYQNNPKRVYLTPPSVDKVGSMLATLDDFYELTYCKENIAVCTRKYEYQKPGTYNYDTGNNYPLMRFADFILCKAEILNELNGPTQEAIDLINRIRRRAFGDTYHNLSLSSFAGKDALREAICDERLFEFNMEGLRRTDLIRMGLWKDRMDKYIASQKAKAEYKAINEGKDKDYYKNEYIGYPTDLTENDIRRYFPIPAFEIELNPELENARNK